MKKNRESKSNRIYAALKAEILSGKYQPDDLFYSESDLIKRFKVSRPTTVRVFHQLRSENLLLRRAGAGTYVCAPPQEKSGNWGVMMATKNSDHTLHPMLSQLLNETRNLHKSLIIGTQKWSDLDLLTNEEKIELLTQPLLQAKIEGLFLVPFHRHSPASDSISPQDFLDPLNLLLLERLQKLKIPVVLIDYGLESFPLSSDYDLVSTDHFLGGYLQGLYLLSKPKKTIVFLSSTTSEFIPSIQARKVGLKLALEKQGIPLHTQNLDSKNIEEIDLFIKKVKPEVIVAFNDHCATELINALFQLQIKVPDQIEIIGFDDHPAAQYCVVPISTIQQPFAALAKVAVKTLLNRIAQPESPFLNILLPPKLLLRQSTINEH